MSNLRLVLQFTSTAQRDYPDECWLVAEGLHDAAKECRMTLARAPFISETGGVVSKAVIEITDLDPRQGGNVGSAVIGTATGKLLDREVASRVHRVQDGTGQPTNTYTVDIG